MLHSYMCKSSRIVLRPLEERDIESLRVWRNDPRNGKYLRKLPEITSEMQQLWFQRYAMDKKELTFAVEFEEQLIGSASLYNFKGDRAEFGKIMIGAPDLKGKGLGFETSLLMLQVAFNQLNLDRVVATVSKENIAAITIYIRLGFCIKGEFYNSESAMDEFKLEIDKQRFSAVNQQQTYY